MACPDTVRHFIVRSLIGFKLLVGHKAVVLSSRTQFVLDIILYPYSQQKVVTNSKGVVDWYDYDNLRKRGPGDET